MELEEKAAGIRASGYGIAGISYDSQEILKDFATRKHLTFPLLSDPKSEIIKRFGILNPVPKSGEVAYGVPHPGIFIVDPAGVVQSKFFEDKYTDRQTASSISLELGGPAFAGHSTTVHADHFDLTLTTSDDRVAPGNHFTLVIDFDLYDRIHVYAPGVKGGYRPIALSIDSSPLLTVHPPRFPEPETYYFEPLNETVPVYQHRFRVLQDVTLAPARETAELFKNPDPTLTIQGKLDYQACDDRVCFNPTSVPLTWTIKLKPQERERVPEPIQHKPSPR